MVYSDKLGYILTTGINRKQDFIGIQPVLHADAETLCEQFYYEIASDVLEKHGGFHDIFESTPDEKHLILEALEPYMLQLPEYNYLTEKLFVATD